MGEVHRSGEGVGSEVHISGEGDGSESCPAPGAAHQHCKNFIESVDILKHITPQERAELMDALESRTYQNGEVIIRKGDDGNEFFFIEEGSVCVSSNGKKLRESGPKQYFGELSLLQCEPRSADVIATSSPTKLLVLHSDGFVKLLSSLKGQ